MKKSLVSLMLLLLLLSLVFPALAQEKQHALKISGKGSLYTPPSSKGAEGSSIMLGVGATYKFAKNLEAEAALEYTTYKVSAGNETLIPATLNVKYYFFPASPVVNLYAGGGLGYNTTILNDVSTGTFGFQLLAGVGFTLGGDFEIKTEAKYSIVDASKPSDGGWSIGAGVSGGMAMGF